MLGSERGEASDKARREQPRVPWTRPWGEQGGRDHPGGPDAPSTRPETLLPQTGWCDGFRPMGKVGTDAGNPQEGRA